MSSTLSAPVIVIIALGAITFVAGIVNSAIIYCKKDDQETFGVVDNDAIELGNLESFLAGGDEFPMRHDGRHAFDPVTLPAPTLSRDPRRDGMLIFSLPAMEFSAVELWPGESSQSPSTTSTATATDEPPPYEPTRAPTPRPAFT